MFNEQLSKEEYEKRMKEMDLQNPAHIHIVKDRVNVLRMKHPHLYSVQEKTENCTGDYIFESKDCINCFQIYRSQDCINVQDAETKDALDCYHPGWSELTYENYSSVTQTSSAFCIQCWIGSDTFYSDNCQSCSHCFGCISLRQKKHCILNKQYTEDGYRAILPKIRTHMEKFDEWGKFFPMEISLFAYNESMAEQDFPLSEKDVRSKGWRWTDHPSRTTGKETMQWERISPNIQDVPKTITAEILACTLCKKNYKIIEQELQQYRERNLPLPRTCPDCRFTARLSLRNPRKLWKRNCAKCKKDIQTTYPPERPEIVYCEQCYLASVY